MAERERAGLTSATAERLMQAGGDGYEHTQTNVQRITEAPLDRLHRQGFVLADEFDAGDRYRIEAFRSAIQPTPRSINWDTAGGSPSNVGVPSEYDSQAIFDARRRWRQTNAMTSGLIQTVAGNALISESSCEEIGRAVFGYRDRKDADLAGRVAVRMVCAALVDLFRA